jgi:hypothetical protein
VASFAAADRLLAEAARSSGPTLVVFERDDGEHGVLLGDGAIATETPR